MKTQNGSPVIAASIGSASAAGSAAIGSAVALVGDLLFVIGVAENHQQIARKPRRSLDNKGNVPLIVAILINVLQILAGELSVPPQVIIGAVMHAFKLAPAHREQVLNVVSVFRVMRKLIRPVLMPAQMVRLYAKFLIIRPAPLAPLIEPHHIRTRLYKELHFHLLKLAGAENKVFGNDFIAERLANLGDAERDFHPVGLNNIPVIYIDTLCGLGAQIDNACGVLSGAYVGLEHQVELARVGQLAAAVGAFLRRKVFCGDHVRPEAGLALFAVDQRVGEIFNVA